MKRLLLLAFSIIIFATLLSSYALAESNKKGDELSPALNIIASKMSMSVSVIVGEDITFSPDAFDDAVGLKKVNEIVINELPSESQGSLMLGSLRVMEGQKIPRSSLKDLRFDNESRMTSASFKFSVDDNEYSFMCNMYILEKDNYAPTSLGINENFFSIDTYKNIAVKSNMAANDPEGDSLVFEVVENPKKGLLTLLSRETGEYVYTPMKNYSGKDSFTYRVVDKYGNRSKEISVDITVKSSNKGAVFTDMIGDYAHYGAILLANKGIMDGYESEKGMVFMPEARMNRCDFLIYAMKALDIEISDKYDISVFSDYEKIPVDKRAYVSTAYKMGVILGKQENSELVFSPDESISRAEACVILCNLLGIESSKTIPVFSDSEKIPEYAFDAVCALSERNIIDVNYGYVYPDEIMNRADTARMLGSVVK